MKHTRFPLKMLEEARHIRNTSAGVKRLSDLYRRRMEMNGWHNSHYTTRTIRMCFVHLSLCNTSIHRWFRQCISFTKSLSAIISSPALRERVCVCECANSNRVGTVYWVASWWLPFQRRIKPSSTFVNQENYPCNLKCDNDDDIVATPYDRFMATPNPMKMAYIPTSSGLCECMCVCTVLKLIRAFSQHNVSEYS